MKESHRSFIFTRKLAIAGKFFFFNLAISVVVRKEVAATAVLLKT